MRFWVPIKRKLRRNLQEHAALNLAILLSKLRLNGENEDDVNNFELTVRIPEIVCPPRRGQELHISSIFDIQARSTT